MQAVAEGGYTDSSDVVEVNMGVAGGVNGLEDPTGLGELAVPTMFGTEKVLIDGNVYIYRNGKYYNLLGGTAQ